MYTTLKLTTITLLTCEAKHYLKHSFIFEKPLIYLLKHKNDRFHFIFPKHTTSQIGVQYQGTIYTNVAPRTNE